MNSNDKLMKDFIIFMMSEIFPSVQSKGVSNPAEFSLAVFQEAANSPKVELVVSRPIGDFMRHITVLYDSKIEAEARAMADKLAQNPDNGTVMLYRLSSGIWAVFGFGSNQAKGGA